MLIKDATSSSKLPAKQSKLKGLSCSCTLDILQSNICNFDNPCFQLHSTGLLSGSMLNLLAQGHSLPIVTHHHNNTAILLLKVVREQNVPIPTKHLSFQLRLKILQHIGSRYINFMFLFISSMFFSFQTACLTLLPPLAV